MSTDAEDFLNSIGAKVKTEPENSEEYDIWVGNINESVLDPVHNTLAKDVWNRNKKLKEKHRRYIIDTFNDWLDTMGVEEDPKDIIIIGSITTYQYSKNSDIDVNVAMDISDEQRDELLKYLPNGSNLPDTNHPVNYYLSKDAMENVEKQKSAYDVLNDKWIKEPKEEDVSFPYGYILEIARFFMDGVDERIAEYERDKKELDLYKEYQKDEEILMSDVEIQKVIEQKKLEIKADLDALYVALKMVKSFRGKAFEEDYEPKFLINIESANRDFSVNNLVYKALERFGYLDKLKEFKDEREKWEE